MQKLCRQHSSTKYIYIPCARYCINLHCHIGRQTCMGVTSSRISCTSEDCCMHALTLDSGRCWELPQQSKKQLKLTVVPSHCCSVMSQYKVLHKHLNQHCRGPGSGNVYDPESGSNQKRIHVQAGRLPPRELQCTLVPHNYCRTVYNSTHIQQNSLSTR